MAGSVPGDERLHPHSKVTHMRKAIAIFISLVLWCFSAMGATPDEVISKVNAAMQERSAVKLDFIQTRHTPLLKENLRSNGSICFAAPQKLRWEVNSPSPSVFTVFIIPSFPALCKPHRREKIAADFGKTVDSKRKVWYNKMK